MQDDKVFFKIVIPNYNNMAYIKKCLDSILDQTFQDFKIVIVDDLSTDLSDKFCEMYAEKYPNKIIFHQLKKKGYAGACRNKALDYKLDSDYVFFIDSDDWLYDKNSLENLYNTILKNKNPDLIRCQYKELINQNIYPKILSSCPSVENLPKLNSGPSCNCIKTTSLGMIRFQENLYRNNDVIWFLKICDKVNSIAITTMPIFVYNRMNPISCQNSNSDLDKKIAADKYIITILKNSQFIRSSVNKRKETYINEITTRSIKIKQMIKEISVNQLMENSFVISFNEKRINIMSQIFKQSCLKMPKIFPAFHNTDLSGPYNCILSHVALIRMAKALDLPFITIFEDDAYPCKQVYLKLKNLLANIPKEASLILLGWSNEAKPYGKQRFDQQFNKITRIISGSHAYIIFNKGYDKYLNIYQQNSTQTADGIFSLIEDSYILNKPLFIQYSNNTSMNKHYGYIFYGNNNNPPSDFKKIEEYKI